MEVEIKARVENMDSIIKILHEMSAQFLREVLEEDEYFNHPCRDFARTDEALRIRNDGTLTYKGPKVDMETKSREEVNVPVGDMESTRKLLVSLGFVPVARVRKVRRYYDVNGLTVCLDTVEGLGDFVEVECIGEYMGCRERVMDMADKLYLKNFIRESYLEMLLEGKNME